MLDGLKQIVTGTLLGLLTGISLGYGGFFLIKVLTSFWTWIVGV